jgi:hypothetical protein
MPSYRPEFLNSLRQLLSLCKIGNLATAGLASDNKKKHQWVAELKDLAKEMTTRKLFLGTFPLHKLRRKWQCKV